MPGLWRWEIDGGRLRLPSGLRAFLTRDVPGHRAGECVGWVGHQGVWVRTGGIGHPSDHWDCGGWPRLEGSGDWRDELDRIQPTKAAAKAAVDRRLTEAFAELLDRGPS